MLTKKFFWFDYNLSTNLNQETLINQSKLMLLSKNKKRKVVKSSCITKKLNLQDISLISTSINIKLKGKYISGML